MRVSPEINMNLKKLCYFRLGIGLNFSPYGMTEYLLLQEQSDLGLYCFIYVFMSGDLIVQHFRDFTVIDMGGSRGGAGGRDPSWKITKNIGLLNNICSDTLKNHKATKPAFNVGPSSARQRNATSMAFPWLANDGPLIVVFESLPSSA